MEETNNKVLELENEVQQLKNEKSKLEKDLANTKLSNENTLAFYKEIEHEYNTLKESESKLRKFFQLSEDALFIIDSNGIIKEINKIVLQMFDFEDESELIGVHYLTLIAEQDIEFSKYEFKKVLFENQNIKDEKHLKKKNGKVFPGIVKACLINKELGLIAALVQDLSEQKRIEIAQKRQIDLVENLSAFRMGIYRSRSLEELKFNICMQIEMFTKASEVWLLKTASNKFEKFYFGKNNTQTSSFDFSEKPINNKKFATELSQLLKLRKRVNHNNAENLIKLPFCTQPKKISNQVIITINCRAEKIYYLGLNYTGTSADHIADIEIIQNISHMLRPAFDSLAAYQMLTQNEIKFRTLTEKQSDVIIVRNLEGKYTYVSPAILNYGFQIEDVIGKKAPDFIHPDDLHLVEPAIKKIIKKEYSSTKLNKIRLKLKNGNISYAQIILTNLLNQPGVEGILANIQNITEHVEFEGQLRESKEIYRTLFENANDAIFLLSNNTIELCNKKTLEIFKAKNESDIIGKSPIKLSPKYQSDGKKSEYESADILKKVNKGEKVSFEWMHRRIDGSIFETYISLSQVKYSGHNYTLAILKDISHIKAAHSEIEANELRLRTIFESMSDGVFLCSDNHEIVYLNKAMKNQLEASGLNNQKCFTTVYGFNRPCKWCTKNRNNQSENVIDEIYNPSNNRIYQVSKTSFKIHEESLTLHISRDITEIKQAENLITQSEEKFRNIFNHSNDAIMITNLNGHYLEANKKALSRSGYSKSEFLEMNLHNVVNYSNSNRIEEYVQEVISNGQAISEVYYINKDGEKFFTEINGRIIDYQGKKSILHISRDITVRKELERKILEATIQTEENERIRFAQDLHDGIGPYLSATKLFLKTLAMEDDLNEREILTSKAVNSIDEIISNIKEISNNISPHVLKNFGLLPAIQSFKKKLKNAEIEIIINSDFGNKRFNENLEISCFRIIIELINNTIKYAEASEINISLLASDEELTIGFTHNGKGFDIDETLKARKGQGLFNIINRVNSLKGTHFFNTSKDKGFHFSARFSNLQ